MLKENGEMSTKAWQEERSLQITIWSKSPRKNFSKIKTCQENWLVNNYALVTKALYNIIKGLNETTLTIILSH